MPPKPKFTKEMLIQTAIELAKEGGLEAIVPFNEACEFGTVHTYSSL